jgi:hypothetical protein
MAKKKTIGEVMEITSMVEHEDGSATLQVTMDEKTKSFLINYAFLDLIKKGMTDFKDEFKE